MKSITKLLCRRRNKAWPGAALPDAALTLKGPERCLSVKEMGILNENDTFF